jgi:molybdate transport system ATP-binding protein
MQKDQPVVLLKNVSVRNGNLYAINNCNLTINKHEQWAIIGASGSGKTTLAHAITGRRFFNGSITFHLPGQPNVSVKPILVEQQHRFRNLSNMADFYYQQRFNASDAGDTITVREALQAYTGQPLLNENHQYWIDLLQLTKLLETPLIQLSNGENKRLQLAEALLANPSLLILDNPFTGLDKEGRETLHSIINTITEKGIYLILLTSHSELPSCITHVALLKDGVFTATGKKGIIKTELLGDKKVSFFDQMNTLEKFIPANKPIFDNAVKMVNVSVRYGDKKILDQINWTVKRGECWSISGPNGAGKSTLLSLITADNPQAYANEMYLFDKRRGKGESIWDIKRQIGYLSPELHLYFEKTATCFDVVASGLFDTIGLFKKLTIAQAEQVNTYIDLLGLANFKMKALFQLSLGQQRMILLARALVKNPPLLILDEPTQGLDQGQTVYFTSLIDELCSRLPVTLLYVSHYEEDIPVCVTKKLQLHEGKIVQS